MIEDSDEEVAKAQITNGRRKATFRSSSPTDGIRSKWATSMLLPTSDLHPQLGQAKKPRLSKAITDDEDEEDEEEASVANSFSQRLTRFKKSPAKKSIFAHIRLFLVAHSMV